MPTSTRPTLTPMSNTRSCHAKLVIGHGLADVVGDLPRFVERTAREQHRELVAADTRDGVRIAHRCFNSEEISRSRLSPAMWPLRVVHELEAVEVEIAHDVAHTLAARRIESGVEPALELGAIHETGERVVARLVRHLAREPAQLAHVVEDHDAARDLAVGPAIGDAVSSVENSRSACLLSSSARRPRLTRRALAQAFRDGIAERAPVDLVDERQEIEQALAEPRAARAAEQLLGRLVHVVDRAVQVRRDHAFADRLERDPRLELAAAERGLEALPMRDVVRDGKEARSALEHEPLAVELRPRGRDRRR